MSQINQSSNFIDPTFPVAGMNNSTAGFRNNFNYTQLAFNQTGVELNKLQKTHLIFLGDITATSGQLDSATQVGQADPTLSVTLQLSTVLTGGGTLNSNTGDFQLTLDEKGRVVGKQTITRTISWGSGGGAGQPINPPSSLGSGSGTVNWPVLVFDQLGRLTQQTTTPVSFGLLGQTIAKGSILTGNASNVSQLISPPVNGKFVLAWTGQSSTGLEWIAQSTTTQPSITTGRWYGNFDGLKRNHPDTIGQNTLRLAPVIIPVTMTIDQMGEFIHTSVNGGNISLGLYAADPVTKMPIGVPLRTTNYLPATNLGPVSDLLYQNSIATPLLIQAGTLLWYGVMADSNTTKILMSSMDQPRYSRLVGSANLSTLLQDDQGTQAIALIASTPFGTWPNLSTNPANETVNKAEPMPLLHCS